MLGRHALARGHLRGAALDLDPFLLQRGDVHDEDDHVLAVPLADLVGLLEGRAEVDLAPVHRSQALGLGQLERAGPRPAPWT